MLPDANGQKENKYILGREELQFYVTKKKKKSPHFQRKTHYGMDTVQGNNHLKTTVVWNKTTKFLLDPWKLRKYNKKSAQLNPDFSHQWHIVYKGKESQWCVKVNDYTVLDTKPVSTQITVKNPEMVYKCQDYCARSLMPTVTCFFWIHSAYDNLWPTFPRF